MEFPSTIDASSVNDQRWNSLDIFHTYLKSIDMVTTCFWSILTVFHDIRTNISGWKVSLYVMGQLSVIHMLYTWAVLIVVIFSHSLMAKNKWATKISFKLFHMYIKVILLCTNMHVFVHIGGTQTLSMTSINGSKIK